MVVLLKRYFALKKYYLEKLGFGPDRGIAG
jgi:hypothetical protein